MHKETFYTNKDIEDTRIAVFSDLHYYPSYPKEIFTKIINQIKVSKPNFIAIIGDLLDCSDYSDLGPLKDFLTTLASITTTLVVTGNHDEKTGYRSNWHNYHSNEFVDLLNSIDNLYYLEDKDITIGNITFYGFNPSYNYYIQNEPYNLFEKEIEKLHPKLNDKNYNITLIHTPLNIYTFLKNNKKHNLNKTDLILSGHTHNGCLPFWMSKSLNKLFHTNRSIISPSSKLFPKYAQGRIYERDGYIYQGISKLSKSTRFFFKFDKFYIKSIAIIDIKKHQ